MDASELSYPVIGFRGPYFTLWRERESLTTQYLSAVRSGYFQRHQILDVNGAVYRITGATPQDVTLAKLLINPLIGQRVKVEVHLQPTGEYWTINELRAAVLREFREWLGWPSREDYDEVLRGVEQSASVRELIDFLSMTLSKR